MKRKRKRTKQNGLGGFELLKATIDGKQYVLYVCRLCSRAWKYADPLEAWRVQSFLSHQGTHGADATVRAMLASAAPDRAEG